MPSLKISYTQSSPQLFWTLPLGLSLALHQLIYSPLFREPILKLFLQQKLPTNNTSKLN